MNMKKLFIASALVFGAFSGLAYAEAPTATAAAPAVSGEQDTLSLLRAGLRMDHREFVKASLALSDDEAKKFWTLYNQYEADMIKVNDQKWQVVKDYADNYDDVSEDKAAELVKNMFDIRQSRTDVMKTYYKKVAKALTNRLAMRFVQIESVWNAASDLKLGTEVPLIPKQ
jgi:Spy/CpxP family protein refolding chaperone